MEPEVFQDMKRSFTAKFDFLIRSLGLSGSQLASDPHILKIYTTLGYIVSLILLNLGHVFRFRIVSRMCEFGRRRFTEVNSN